MYDYVIVGAGSAGCVLATRLTEDPDVSVLLLESGPPDVNENIHVPLGVMSLLRTEVDWNYYSAPEAFCGGRRIPLPRGRTLGGSSSINNMIYIRGHRADYDGWGIPGWTYDDLLPYFKKAEDNEHGEDEFHGAGGPLPVSDSRSKNVMGPAFVQAGIELGFPGNEDFNGAEQDGFGSYQVTMRGGMRASAAVAYLHPAMERPNLTVMPYMHTHRILFEGTRAVGVVASQLGQFQEYRAEREVILCAGAYNSPQLLMLSGVGPAEHLMLREVDVLLDQPAVGENLTDHPATYGVWSPPEPVSLLLALEPAALQEFEESQTGPFASNVAEAGSFVRLESGASAPDIQFHMIPVQIVDEGMTDPTDHGMLITPCVLQEESRGSVRLGSNDPTAHPIIRNNFYAAEKDMRLMMDAMKLTIELANQPAMKPYCAAGSNVPASDSEEDLREHIARTTFAIYHPVGTCAMGSVVGDELGGRGGAAGQLPRGIAGRPRFGHADGAARQHQRADDRRGRASRRSPQAR